MASSNTTFDYSSASTRPDHSSCSFWSVWRAVSYQVSPRAAIDLRATQIYGSWAGFHSSRLGRVVRALCCVFV